jgi:polar amino acid transport system permease protein
MNSLAIEAHDVSKTFNGRTVLDSVTLSVGRGRVTTVLGRSGSGKSTLCRILAGLEKPDSGSIVIDGTVLSRHFADGSYEEHPRRRQLRRKIGMVFQSYALFPHMTLRDNVALGPRKVLGMSRDAARQAADDALDRVGLRGKGDSYPAHISGGERQRGAIARELGMKREVLLLDEPTSALDPELVGGVLDSIKELTTMGLTLIIVTHELQFAREVSTNVVFIDEGEVVCEATPVKFFGEKVHPKVDVFLSRHAGTAVE